MFDWLHLLINLDRRIKLTHFDKISNLIDKNYTIRKYFDN